MWPKLRRLECQPRCGQKFSRMSRDVLVIGNDGSRNKPGVIARCDFCESVWSAFTAVCAIARDGA